MPKAQLPPDFEIYARIFNTPEKITRFANEVLGVSRNHASKILRGEVRSDLGRVCAAITLASSFPDERWERSGANLQRAGMLADYAREHYVLIQELNSPAYRNEHERVADSAVLLKEAVDAVNALQLGATPQDTLKELVELRDAAEAAMARLGAGVEQKP